MSSGLFNTKLKKLSRVIFFVAERFLKQHYGITLKNVRIVHDFVRKVATNRKMPKPKNGQFYTPEVIYHPSP
jgi:hypothetical protein